MGYFRQLPNIQTLNRTKNDVSIDETVIIKNLFRRAKIRDDIIDVVTAFEYYQVTENETPNQVAQKIYGNPELDWVILLTNNIINIQNEWPIDSNSFNNYLFDKYGSEEKLLEVRYYETSELRDSFGRVVLEQGLIVDQTFYDAPEYRNVVTTPVGIIYPPIFIAGTQASATAVVNQNLSVSEITGIVTGLGYKTTPTVSFSEPPTTVSASVNASVSGFAVTSFNTLTGGKGYLTTPTITISPPPNSIQATATCVVDPLFGNVSSINITNGGSGYGVTAPTVTIEASPNIIEGSYINQSSIAIGNQVDGMFIRENGLDVYTTSGAGNYRVKQYVMSVAWDVSTVSFVREFDTNPDLLFCTGVEFKPDGSRMFVTGGAGGSYRVIAYDLSTPWDISTATKVHETFISSPGGVRLNPDGSKLFLLAASASGVISQYPLSTAWDITSMSSPETTIDLSVLTGETINLGFSFASDGKKLFTTGQSTSKIFEFNLTTPFSFIGGVSFINDFYVGGQLGNPSDIILKADNTKFIVCGGSSERLFEYETITLAKATATLTNGSVTNIAIDAQGLGYPNPPVITLSAPYPAVQATATANMVSETTTTKTWDVINSASENYLFTGHSSGSDINITATIGDTLVFNVNANGHPFWIKTAQTVGTGNSVTTGTITNNGVTGNVGVVIPITWNTTGVAAGTYYYVCENHITMSGTITISTPTAGAKINSITLTNGGFGYLFNPTVSITPAPTYRTAVGFAVLNSTTGISTITLTDGGANYTTPPTITIGAPQEIQKVFVGDIHFQNNQYWRWNGTVWQEKFTEEFKYFDGATSTVKAIQGNLVSKPITNYEYEINLNEQKRRILILKPQYLSLVVTDLKNMMKYNPESSTYISDNLKSTYNPKYTRN